MNGLQGINIELTSRCNKSCFCCGRRKLERDFPELVDWGDMPLEMVQRIAHQIPEGILIQLHNSGEPLLYPHLYTAIKLFKGHYLCLNTNGKLLMEQREAICEYTVIHGKKHYDLASITISVIPDDPEGEEQLDMIDRFLQCEERPLTVFRLLGEIDDYRAVLLKHMAEDYEKTIICHRILHAPEGSHDYEQPVTIPEIGICLEMLHKLCIDRFGNVSPCVRFDPLKKNLLGNLDDPVIGPGFMRKTTLEDVWNSVIRKEWIQHHINGERDRVPLCQSCDFWGVPRG